VAFDLVVCPPLCRYAAVAMTALLQDAHSAHYTDSAEFVCALVALLQRGTASTGVSSAPVSANATGNSNRRFATPMSAAVVDTKSKKSSSLLKEARQVMRLRCCVDD
jgi:hypothetical protein